MLSLPKIRLVAFLIVLGGGLTVVGSSSAEEYQGPSCATGTGGCSATNASRPAPGNYCTKLVSQSCTTACCDAPPNQDVNCYCQS
jgi:hypothetical protein